MSRAEARLYEVRTPRGTVYAVYEIGTSRFWTERADAVAREVARERGLTLVDEQSITLDEFLRLTGRQPIEPVPGGARARGDALGASQAAPSPPPPVPVRFEIASLSDPAASNLGAQPGPALTARYFLEGAPAPAEDGIVVVRAEAPPPKGVFCSEPPQVASNTNDPAPGKFEP